MSEATDAGQPPLPDLLKILSQLSPRPTPLAAAEGIARLASDLLAGELSAEVAEVVELKVKPKVAQLVRKATDVYIDTKLEKLRAEVQLWEERKRQRLEM